MQNLADILIAHGEFLAENDINLEKRHRAGKPVKLLSDEPVPLDRGRSHNSTFFRVLVLVKCLLTAD